MPVSNRTVLLTGAAIALLTVLVYLPVLSHEFVEWDDDVFIVGNPMIRSLNGAFLHWAFLETNRTGNWHPLTWISHAVDYALWGLKPAGHHLTNILLHGVNTLLVFLLVLRLSAARGDRPPVPAGRPPDPRRASMIAAASTAFLFGLHPLHVESVAWAIERKDLLCGLFSLLAVIAYLRYAAQRDAPEPAPSTRRAASAPYLISLGCFLLALMSKAMAVTLPAVLLLLDWYPLNRVRSRGRSLALLAEKVPFLLGSLGVALVTVHMQGSVSAVADTNLLPLAHRIVVAADSLLVYLGKTLWPAGLVPFYPLDPDVDPFSVRYLAPLLVVIAITAAVALLGRRQPFWLAVWCYYVISLLPVLGLVKVGLQSMADRYMYLPGIGPFVVIGVVLAHLDARPGSSSAAGRFVRIAVLSLVILSGAALIAVTHRQIAVWRNGITLWTSVLDRYPNANPYASYYNRGLAHLNHGLFSEAVMDFNKLITYNPFFEEAYYWRGMSYLRKGDLDEAVRDLSKAIELKPSYAPSYGARGQAHYRAGRMEEAASDLDKAISSGHAGGEDLLYRGLIELRSGRWELARMLIGQACARGNLEACRRYESLP